MSSKSRAVKRGCGCPHDGLPHYEYERDCEKPKELCDKQPLNIATIVLTSNFSPSPLAFATASKEKVKQLQAPFYLTNIKGINKPHC